MSYVGQSVLGSKTADPLLLLIRTRAGGLTFLFV